MFVVLEKSATKIQKVDNIDDLWPFFNRSDAYMFYNSYFSYVKQELLKTVEWFVIDVDYVRSKALKSFMKVINNTRCKPNYILNSGSGVHLIYLIEPIEAYNKNKKLLKDINIALQTFYKVRSEKYNYKIDMHSITHAYRLPGSLTKLGQVSRLYLVKNNRYKLEELANWLNIKNAKYDLKKSKFNPKSGNSNILYKPNARAGFFWWLVNQMEFVGVGHRYLYLFSLAIAGYKVNLNKETLYEELLKAFRFFNTRDRGKLERNEIDKALEGYSQRFVRVRWETIKEWTGLRESVKRVGLPMHLHIKKMVLAKVLKKEARKERTLKLKEKGYKVKDIAKILSLSEKTIRRYLK